MSARTPRTTPRAATGRAWRRLRGPLPARGARRALLLGVLCAALLVVVAVASGSWRVPADSRAGVAPGSGAEALALIRLADAPPGGGGPPVRDWLGYGARGALALLTLPLLFWLVRRPRVVNRIEGPGFEVISPTEQRRFIALEERFQALDFLSRVETDGQLRLSANLNKVTLSIRKYGYLMEDKNYRNALLVNRRRVRRTLLRDGDVLDLGDLTLLYRDNRAARIVNYASVTPPEGKAQIRFDRLKGPVRRGMPMLVPEQQPNRPFYVTKNKVFMGRSDNNDLVIKSRNVYYRHAKLERVGGRWKLQDLSVLGNTFVNNRRVEQRFLKDGDEIAIEAHRFRFGFVTRTMRDRPPAPHDAAPPDEADETPPEALAGNDAGEGEDDAEYASTP